MPAKQDLTGKIFGKLTVVGFSHSNKNSVSFYICKCECGNEKIISGINLARTTKPTRSCGCQLATTMKDFRSENPLLLTAKKLWKRNYSDGCSFEKFLELSQMPCHYCGVLKFSRSNRHITHFKNGKISEKYFNLCWFEYNGIDRINSSKSHNEDNIVPCCIICNRAKSNLSIEDFKNWLNKVYFNYIKEEK